MLSRIVADRTLASGELLFYLGADSAVLGETVRAKAALDVGAECARLLDCACDELSREESLP
jgi:hypothetical protein